MLGLLGLGLLLLAVLAVEDASAQVSTVLRLDPIPSPLRIGDTVTFSGTLESTDGRYVITGADIDIKDDDPGFDDRIARTTTNRNGEFRVSTTVRAWDSVNTNAEIYAVFEGSNDARSSRSTTQSVRITEASTQVSTILRLDQIPSPLQVGDTVTFSGTLESTDGRYVITGADIDIKDDDPGFDDRIARTTTNRNGEFRVSTTVRAWDSVNTNAEIYAVFEGSNDARSSRSTTQSVRITEASTQVSTILRLDQIPSPLQVGDTVTFSGTLQSTDGRYVITGANIDIKDDDTLGSDDLIARTTTNRNGEFRVSATVRNWDPGDSYVEIYAVFEGSNDARSSRSTTQNVRITEVPVQFPTILRLDRISSPLQVGDTVVFSGTLMTTDGRSVRSATIDIKDDDTLGPDDLIASTVTDSNGRFSVSTTVRNWDEGSSSVEIYAVFEGGNNLARARSTTQSVRIAEAGPIPLTITLDRIPARVNVGDTVVFSGTLTTTDGRYVTGATIDIKDDDTFGPDDLIARTTTDSNGRFIVRWVAQDVDVDSVADIYAVFEGSQRFERARSANQEMAILQYSSSITLDPIPARVRIGDTVVFSGTLNLEGNNPAGATVYIQDDDPGFDDLLASAIVDQRGRFTASWTVQNVDEDSIADIYAVYEGNQYYERARSANQEMAILRISSSIILDPLPARVNVGDIVVFSGTLNLGGNNPAGAIVYIRDEDPGPDDPLTGAYVDQNGRFVASWTAQNVDEDSIADIYAVYEGNQYFESTVSAIRQLPVLKYSGGITLDPVPSNASIGDIVVFSGTLTFDGYDPAGAIVYIKDEDPGFDDLLATAFVDQNGGFTVSWIVRNVDEDSVADIYAVFEGNDAFDRQTTCGAGCGMTQKLQITEPAPPPEPEPIPPPRPQEYMTLYYSMDLVDNPKVAIVPSPDSFDIVSGHVPTVWDGVLMWKDMLEARYGGDWGVDIQVITSATGFAHFMPDVVINLVTGDDDPGCINEYLGVALVQNVIRPVETRVCSEYMQTRRDNVDVAATSAHEFIHAMGLGHTFNGINDLMCSAENGIPTCFDTRQKSRIPSALNLAAVVELYGRDGFKNPNFGYAGRFILQESGLNPITVSTDRVSYDSGETIMVTGQVQDRVSAQPVTLSIFTPNGNLAETRQLSVAEDSTFATEFGTAGSIWRYAGTYTIRVQYGPDISTDTTLEYAGSDRTAPITVSVDRASYRLGDTITVAGKVRDQTPATIVTLLLSNPDGNYISIESVTPAANGTFQTHMSALGPLWSDGTYTITARDGSDMATDTFEYAGDETTVQYSITGGQVLRIAADADSNSLIMAIDSTDDGILDIELPGHVIVSKDNGTQGDDTDFFVLVDSVEIEHLEMPSSGARILAIPFAAGSESVEIIGSWIAQDKTLYSNGPPAGQDITITVAPGRTAGRDIAGIISDPEGNNITVAVSRQPSQGNASASGTTVSYTARPDAVGADSFGYILVDEFGASSVWNATVMISGMAGANQDPAAPDILINAELHFPSAVTPAVMDPAGGNVTITGVTGNTLGSLDTSMLPQISYTPNQTGIDMLTYMVSDDRGGTANATISIFINPDGNARPVLNHIYNVGGRVGVDLNFTAIAADDENDPLTFDIANAPDGASITAGGDFSWRPTSPQDGTHTVTFIVYDDHGGADWQHVAVTILRENETNLPPMPQDIDAGVVLGGGRGFQPDIDDPENDGTEIVRVYDSSLGDVDRSFLSQGIIVYVAGVLGDDEVVYTVSDGRGSFANGTISITVEEPANVRPLIDFVGDKSVNAGDELTFTVDAEDLDGFVTGFELEGETQGPSMSPQGVFSWTPTANDVGRHEFTILVFDDAGENSTVSITVTVRPEGYRNSPPVAPDVVIMTPQDVLSIVRPTLTDPDEGDPVRISETGNTAKGSILSGFLRAGIIIYLPNQGETGTETITYTVSDSSDDTDTATINVFISARGNTDPILGSIYFRNINAGNPLTFDLEAEDPDGDTISYQTVGAPDGVEISPEGAFSWTPTVADVGNHTFTIVAYDDRGGADSKTAVIRVLPAGTANQAPNAPDSSVTVAAGGSIVITPVISDPDGDRVIITDAVASGTGVVIQSEDSINYIHVATTPTETVTYTVTDARGATSTGTITITIR